LNPIHTLKHNLPNFILTLISYVTLGLNSGFLSSDLSSRLLSPCLLHAPAKKEGKNGIEGEELKKQTHEEGEEGEGVERREGIIKSYALHVVWWLCLKGIR
jgi:hypothetical protein